MYLMIHPKPQLGNRCRVPSSLLDTQLAMFAAALANGRSILYNDLRTSDTLMMKEACKALGALIIEYPDHLEIIGTAGNIHNHRKLIDCGHNALVLQLFTAMASVHTEPMALSGSAVLRKLNMQPLLNALRQLGASIEVMGELDGAPLIHWGGGIIHDVCDLSLDMNPDSVIALMFMGSLVSMPLLLRLHESMRGNPTILRAKQLLTERGICIETDEYLSLMRIHPGTIQVIKNTIVADDILMAQILVLFALFPGHYQVDNMTSASLQNGEKIIQILKQLGVAFQFDEIAQCLLVSHQSSFAGDYCFDVSDNPKLFPILVALGAFVHGRVRVVGVGSISHPVSAEITTMLHELRKLGVAITALKQGELLDGVELFGCASYQGGVIFDHGGDPYLFIAFAMITLRCRQANYFTDDGAAERIFPDFISELQRLGIYCEYIEDVVHPQPYWLTA